MKKCTLCIDRIYNDNLAPEERQPACVMVCPTKARFFGDLGDPNSAVSELVAARAGTDPDAGSNEGRPTEQAEQAELAPDGDGSTTASLPTATGVRG